MVVATTLAGDRWLTLLDIEFGPLCAVTAKAPGWIGRPSHCGGFRRDKRTRGVAGASTGPRRM